MTLLPQRLAACLIVLIALSPPVLAQVAEAIPGSLAEPLAQARKSLAENTALDEANKANLHQKLDQADADEAQANAHLLKAKEWKDDQDQAQQRIPKLETELRADPEQRFDQWQRNLREDSPAETLSTELAELRASAGNLTTQVAEIAAELGQSDQRPAQLVQELDLARREAVELLQKTTLPANASLAQRIDTLAAQAARRERLARIEALLAERNALPVQSRVLELSQRSLQRQAALARRQADALEALLARSSSAETTALSERLRDEAETSSGQSEVVIREAERNVTLGQELIDVQNTTREASERLRNTQDRATDATDSLRNIQARLTLHSGDETLGLILLNERRRVEEPAQIQHALQQTRRKLAQTQLRALDLSEQAERLNSPEQVLEQLVQLDDDDPDAAAEAATRQHLLGLLNTRADLIARLETAERELMNVLTDLEGAQNQQLQASTQLARLLDQELLWYPSHDRVGRAWLQRQIEGWRDLFKPSRYATSSRLLLETLKRDWLLVLMVLGLFVLLLRVTRKLPARLLVLAQPLLRIRIDRYRHTLRALAASLMAAATWPLPLALLGWLLRQSGQPGKFSDSLGQACLSLAGGLLFFQSMRYLLLENGVAHKHFRWTRARREAIRAALPWFVLLVLPAQFLLTLAFVRGQEPALDAVSRLMLLVICIASAHICWRLLAPGALWTFRGRADVEPSRLRRLLRGVLPLGFVALALITLNGYLLTAITLLHGFWHSLLLVSALAVLHGLISRWFLLGERRLALSRLDARHEAGQEAQNLEIQGGESNPASSLDPETELISIQSINQQTRSLLRALTLTLLVSGLIWVWSDVLPALDRLDTISLWSVASKAADGSQILTQISLAAFLGGALALLLTFIAARNLPGLVEIGLLARIDIDAGARYAITSISRYVIVIAGLIIGLGLMGVRWSQLQWMAAALTVGLGFGLQEIFANFVSGLIVLFERPYRVGDMITIGEAEGTVTRIRTRATTVLDSSNREVIVPNKTFITSRFINWTLSDTVTRITFNLELAQDADPVKVRTLLLDLARNEPLVLSQPGPSCWFSRLSKDSFDFDLSVHVAELGHRSRVRSELNRKMAEALAAAGFATSRPGEMRIEMLEKKPSAETGAV